VPQVSSIAEAGYPEIGIGGCYGGGVPSNMARALVDEFGRNVRMILAQRLARQRMIAAGFDLADPGLAQFGACVGKGIKRCQRIVKESNVKLAQGTVS
jgi:hypothetical protein